MDYLEAVILGILQGLCEFLPVSSSGHLVLAQNILGINEGTLLFNIMLHVGTLAAVFTVFWRDIWSLLKRPFQRLTLMLILATIPATIAALWLGDAVESFFGGRFLGLSFLVTAVFVFLISRFKDGSDEVGTRGALVMGVMQAFALAPGVSRSGSTILGGVLSGINREAAARFSFLMSIPAILGSLVLNVKDLLEVGAAGGAGPVAVGMLTAAITGYIAIRWMLSIIKTRNIVWFSVYTAVLGLLILVDQFYFHVFF